MVDVQVSIACIPVSIICVLPEMLSLMMRDVTSLASKPCPVPSRVHYVLELPSQLKIYIFNNNSKYM